MKALFSLALLAQSALATQFPYQGDTLALSQSGLTLGGQTLAGGTFEPLALSQDGSLLMAVTKADQVLLIWQGQQQVFSAPVKDRVVEAVCSYQSPRDGSLHLFILDDRGSGEEWLVRDGAWRQAPLKLRTLAIPYKSTACATDSGSQSLYIAEDDQAIWRYSAELEAEPKRQLVDVAAPFGPLQGETQALAVRADGLLVRAAETGLDFYPAAASKSPSAGRRQLPLNLGETGTLVLDAKGAHLGGKAITLPAMTVTRPAIEAIAEVKASAQTATADRIGDAMDDPAIWLNRQTPAQSRILGTDKRGALEVYNLAGERLQRLAVGRINNVDVRYGFELGGQTLDIAAASQRDHNSIQLFAIAPESGEVEAIGEIPTPLSEIYGLCMYQPQGQLQVIVNDQSGRVLQYGLKAKGAKVTGELLRDFAVPSQPEGCVADDQRGRLFLGEEDVGIWVFDADPQQAPQGQLIAKVGDKLHADVEGLALWQGKEPLLVASSQGNDSYVLYSALPPYDYQGRFRIGLNGERAIDGASETDGLEVTAQPLPGYPQGLLVVQDGRKQVPQAGQNFKLVSFAEVLALLQQ